MSIFLSSKIVISCGKRVNNAQQNETPDLLFLFLFVTSAVISYKSCGKTISSRFASIRILMAILTRGEILNRSLSIFVLLNFSVLNHYCIAK